MAVRKFYLEMQAVAASECANQLHNDGGTRESYTRYDINL